MRKYIHSFNVEDLTSLSDHRPLTLKLKYIKNNEIKQNLSNLLPKPKRFCIKNIETYRKQLENEMNLNTITSFTEKVEKCSNDRDINNMTQEITKLSINVANKVNQIDSLNPKYKKTKKQEKSKNKIWYNNECKTRKRQLNSISKSLNRNPNDESKRILFYKTQKSYKKLLKDRKKQYEEQLMNKMEYLYTNNKSEFWKFLKSMKNERKNDELPQLNTLIDHFKNLFLQETDNDVIYDTENTSNEQKKDFDILNTPIIQKEVEEGIHNLKSRKSPGFDCVTNEMLKCTTSHGKKLLTLLINKVLKSGIFPYEWNYGMIKLINKGMDVYDANDYRGITLNSCLGKLFCTILYNRIAPLLENKNILCKEQAGFRQNHRNTDHIFLLRTIIKKIHN